MKSRLYLIRNNKKYQFDDEGNIVLKDGKPVYVVYNTFRFVYKGYSQEINVSVFVREYKPLAQLIRGLRRQTKNLRAKAVQEIKTAIAQGVDIDPVYYNDILKWE